MPNQRGNLAVILGVIVLVIVVGGGAYYLGTQKSNIQTPQINSPSPTTTQHTNIVTSSKPNPTTSINKKSGWKTYRNRLYLYVPK